MDIKDLIERLNRHPHIKTRLEILLNVAENSSGEFDRADDAEHALVEEIRKMGQELLQGWATNQNIKKELETKNLPNITRHSKKNCIGKQLSEKSK